MTTVAFVGYAHIHTPGFIEKSRKTPGFSQRDIRLRAFPKARYFGCRV